MKKLLYAFVLLTFTLSCSSFRLSQTFDMFPPVYEDHTRHVDDRVDDLVSRMTLEEKVSQTVHNAPAIPRLNVPAYYWANECLHGVAYEGIFTVFPQSIGLAATWDTVLMLRVATAISDEARAKYNESMQKGKTQLRGLDFWSPNINIFRDPRWGRGQETYGEDPYLTARMAVAYVKGLQGDDTTYLKVVSTPKHYAVHSGPDPIRYRFNALADDHDLYDTYLPAFEASVREAKAFSVMGAYNRFNSIPCCAHPLLLENILRKDWGFQGYVVSDCDAIWNIVADHHYVDTTEEASAISVKAGCDLNCGETYQSLVAAVQQGLISEDEITRSVKRLFEARFRLGMFDPLEIVPYTYIPIDCIDSPEHRALALEAARKSIVLLKNDNSILPLSKDISCVAVIGPNADDYSVLMGNYCGTPSRAVLPLEAIRNKVSTSTKVIHARGCELNRYDSLVIVPSSVLRPPDAAEGENGLRGEYFNNLSCEGEPVLTRLDPQINFDWMQSSPDSRINNDVFSVRWTGTITPLIGGEYVMGMRTDDGCRLVIDGATVFENWSDHARLLTTGSVTLEAERPHTIDVEFYENKIYASAQLFWSPPGMKPFEEALEAARQADVVIAFVGISPDLENEGFDRDDITLPDAQEKMLQAVHELGKPMVVVFMNGGPVTSLWIDEHIPAILDAWYPGEEGGSAIADVIFGDYSPGGRLPVTVYKSLDQVPDIEDYSMKSRTYRYFSGEPLYPFGFGLSYTTFEYSELVIEPQHVNAGESVLVSVNVKNTGSCSGDEVVQVYLVHQKVPFIAPLKALKGFKRITLQPGEQQTVSFEIDADRYALINEQGEKVFVPGEVIVSVGDTSGTFVMSQDN